MSQTQLTIDLNSVSYCKFFYENRKGDTRRTIPKYPTVNESRISDELAALPNGRYENAVEYATRRNLLDTWYPVCIYQFRNNHSMRFSGDEAKKMKRNYDKHIYA